MKRKILLLLSSVFIGFTFAQQLSIPRIDLMHNMPSPYVMRDWKKVALNYDNLVFNTSLTGTYLPLTNINQGSGVNYPAVKDIHMDSYVGQTNHGTVAEAINIIPAIVGPSLLGVDKSNQSNVNWVVKVKDFFNRQNGENVYLNNYSAGTGGDWWYEIMPSVYFYQLYSIYPTADPDFPIQFTTIANREFAVLNKLGGTIQPWSPPNMNYRAFDLISGTPNSTSVPEPEAAGSIAWLMYQAYLQTGNFKYLEGAELGLDFLQNWNSNPSYEVQLPYGIQTAARMNAIEGTNYNILKFLNWTFSAGPGTLRGWGTIVGNWNGYDASGLIGEANDAGNDYAFCMNGFQHAATLAPVAKYDKRFSRELGKWLLNLANASRLYYRNGLPQANQEPASYVWSLQFDTASCIPNESMKQILNGVSPFSTGDAIRGGGAATNLALYSGSSVGYLASIISTTNVPGILQVDLNKTDFRGDKTYPAYLYYNPATTAQSVQFTLPSGNFDVYDAITEKVLQTNAGGVISITIPSDSVRQLVVYPTGNVTQIKGRLKLVNGHIIDYHVGYNYTNPLRIKAFSVSDTVVQKLNTLTLYCLPENTGTSTPSFQWFQNNQLIATTTAGNYTWTAPSAQGIYQLNCRVSENGDTVSSVSLSVNVVNQLIIAPIVSDVTFSSTMPFGLNSTVTASAVLNTPLVNYSWSTGDGSLTDNLNASPTWNLPNSPGIYHITLTVTNASGTASFTKPVLVKDLAQQPEPTPLIYYPFNGDTKNHAQNAFNGISVNAVPTTGANGVANGAYQFASSSSYIDTPNDDALNFQDKIALSFWVRPDAFPPYEQFIISHGSWEERYKISIIPGQIVRWTVRTNSATVDLDADTTLQIGKYDHYTAVYTGYSMELYRNGSLSSFKEQTGQILRTFKSLTIARKDSVTTDYNFIGAVDEVRIYDADLSQQLIQQLPHTFKLFVTKTDSSTFKTLQVFPNPFIGQLSFNVPSGETVNRIEVFDLLGKRAFISTGPSMSIQLTIPNGFYILRVTTASGKIYKARIIKKN